MRVGVDEPDLGVRMEQGSHQPWVTFWLNTRDTFPNLSVKRVS